MRVQPVIVALVAGLVVAAPATAAPRACHPTVHEGVVPSWARAGFSSPRPRMPLALSRHHRIAVLVFGFPLVAPPDKDRSNKILWVSHASLIPGDDLQISAQRMTGTQRQGPPLHRTVPGGPGPSIVDLPAGCWRLSLRWSGHRDTIDLRYRRPA
jgi:hypothetical protein